MGLDVLSRTETGKIDEERRRFLWAPRVPEAEIEKKPAESRLRAGKPAPQRQTDSAAAASETAGGAARSAARSGGRGSIAARRGSRWRGAVAEGLRAVVGAGIFRGGRGVLRAAIAAALAGELGIPEAAALGKGAGGVAILGNGPLRTVLRSVIRAFVSVVSLAPRGVSAVVLVFVAIEGIGFHGFAERWLTLDFENGGQAPEVIPPFLWPGQLVVGAVKSIRCGTSQHGLVPPRRNPCYPRGPEIRSQT